MDTKSHYKNHLSQFYSWMFGDFSEMTQRQKSFFQLNKITPRSTKVAIDLGSGSGFQSLALSEMGFQVHAVDFSAELLTELKNKNSEIEIIENDIRDLSFASKLNPELIVCMGDTITHLDSKKEVFTLIKKAGELLKKDGHLIFTFRDLSQPKIELDRFIPVQSDESRILTCFLEDDGEKVKVNDLLWERIDNKWFLRKSFYKKIKLTASELQTEMENCSFSVLATQLPSGLEVLIGNKT